VSVVNRARRLSALACAASLFAGSPAPVAAQAKPVPKEAADHLGSDPAAVKLRDRLIKAYRELPAIHERVTQRQWKSSPDEALTIEIELRYRKPNRLFLSVDYPQVGNDGHWQLVYACDGKTLTAYNSARNEFQTTKAGPRLDRLILPQSLRGPEFIALFRDNSPFGEIEQSESVRYSEAFETSAEASWHTLRIDLHQDGAKRTLRYQIGPKDNIVHRLTLAIVPDSEDAGPFADPEVKSNIEANYTLVDTSPHFTDADFRFIPPKGATEIKPTRNGSPDEHDKRAPNASEKRK